MPCMSGDNLSTHKKKQPGFPLAKGGGIHRSNNKNVALRILKSTDAEVMKNLVYFWAKRLVGYTQVTAILAEGHRLLLSVQHATSEMPKRKPRKTHEAFWWNPRLEKALEVYQASNEKGEGHRRN